MVSAGNRPRGDKSFWTGIEPFGKDWTWDYYTYWCEMRGSPPRGQTWGNSFIRDDQLKVERGRWICVEVMVKMNDVGDTNGEMALWIDGKPVSHLGKGFPKGKWVFDKFLPGQGGDSVRWNDKTRRPGELPDRRGRRALRRLPLAHGEGTGPELRLGLPVHHRGPGRSRQQGLVRRHRRRDRVHRADQEVRRAWCP